MSGGNPTTNCSAGSDALKQCIQCSSQMECPSYFKTSFPNSIRDQIWRVDALLIVEAVLAVIIVGIGAYGQRYRHHPFTRFIFLGATTLFLPIVSYVASTVTANPDYVKGEYDDINHEISAMVAICDGSLHFYILIIWAVLVQIVMVNTSTITAVEDREGRSVGPSIELIVQGIWTIYLGLAIWSDLSDSIFETVILFMGAFSPLCAKIVLKYCAFEKARRSVALGRNPGLVFVYMEQLQVQDANQHSEPPVSSDAPPPPPLLVMREEEKQVELHPRGTRLMDNTGLVTFDRVWQLDSSVPAISAPQQKDICLSFALFKLLRCRFARYKLANAGSMGDLTFFRSLLLGE
ncbi:unnamed protein product [Urochloa decumbens]|uniref:DUF4220 domain-containing protein n=1 Tax=Urochloa decumbens TaxID=240449 RepID=A0ABC9FMH2_9POAL